MPSGDAVAPAACDDGSRSAGLFEIVWAAGLKHTDGFTRLWLGVGTIAAIIVSMFLLALAARKLPIGAACAVRTGIGAVGAVILGIFFGESASSARLVWVSLIIRGNIGLKLLTPAS